MLCVVKEALQFRTAERLVYERNLVHLLPKSQNASIDPVSKSTIMPTSLQQSESRALTYERLAKLFYDEGNKEMCTSYAMKAIQLRRAIKSKWGDEAKMSNNELTMHRLAVMGQESYEETLRRVKGEEEGGEIIEEVKERTWRKGQTHAL